MKARSQNSGISSNTIMILIAIALLLVAITIFWQSTTSTIREKFEGGPKLTVMLFHATWCPHCVNYLKSGDWENQQKTTVAKYRTVKFDTIDFDKHPKDKSAKYMISSFPTIVAEDSTGRVYHFLGDRSKPEHMGIFVDNALKGRDVPRSAYS